MEIKVCSNSIDSQNIKHDVIKLLKYFEINWEKNDICVEKLLGGASNVLFVVSNKKLDESENIIFRIFSDIPIDRNLEIIYMIELSKNDLMSKIIGQFNNGLCYGYIPGNVLDINQLYDQKIYLLIIKELAKLHSLNMKSIDSNKLFIFRKIREFTLHLPLLLENIEDNKKYQNEFPSQKVILKELSLLENQLINLEPQISFTHNDLLVKNIILSRCEKRIHFIDYEYADFNYSAFDIGNHFNEYAGFDNPDYSLYPNRAFQLQWLKEYLREINNIQRNTTTTCYNSSPSVSSDDLDKCVEVLFRQVNKCALLSHLLWATWSIWQYLHSNICDLDYLEYGLIRWKEYQNRRDEFFNL